MAKVWRLALDSLDPQALRTLQIMSMLSPNEVYEDMLFGEWEDPELDFLTDSRRFESVLHSRANDQSLSSLLTGLCSASTN